ncbi:MAG: winged helix DNA-binding domain-containing protein [Clostridia bacterium]|nr:winged helix DNA-binding domain-containing protein [Clostridia bacterium]
MSCRLYRDGFVGRIEPVADRKNKVIEVRNFWPEEGFDSSSAFRTALMQALDKLAKYNKCKEVKILCSI